MLMFLVQTYVEGPLEVRFANSTRTYATFCNTFWLIPRCSRQPLDRYVNSTGRMLGFTNVRCFSRELVEPLNYKYPLPLSISYALSSPQAAEIHPCVYIVRFGSNGEGVFEVSLQGGNVTLPSSFLCHYAA
jgi:hypothetical protein